MNEVIVFSLGIGLGLLWAIFTLLLVKIMR